jgi:hypothetical protein
VTLLSAELQTFRKANKIFSKYQRAKRTRLGQKDIFIIKDTNNIITQNKIVKQVRRNEYSSRVTRNKGQQDIRYYNTCGESSYNSCICQEDTIIIKLLDSE